jgi:hypothetical protein
LLRQLTTILDTIADAVEQVKALAQQIAPTAKICLKLLKRFLDTTDRLEATLAAPVLKLPLSPDPLEVADIIGSSREWLRAFTDLIGCLQEAGSPLVQLLNAPTKIGLSPVKLIQNLIGGSLSR